jgi:amidase
MRLTRRGLLATVAATGFAACSPAAEKPAAAGAPKTISSETDATELAAMIKRGDITAAEAVEAAIKRAEAIQPQINFLVTDTYEMARSRSKETLSGVFAGVPFLVKDLNGVKGVQTRLGSRVTEHAPVEEKDSFIVETMFKTGVVSIGKSTAPENGYLPTTEPLAFPPTRNPWNIGYSSGGSSGGSAAAVAAGVVPIAHANDGGGSIRFPSANCGLVGLKPSRNRMNDGESDSGPLNIAVQGCVSRTVRDTAAFFAACEMQTGGIYPAVGLVSAPGTKRLKAGLITKGFAGNDAETEVAAIVRAAAKLMEGLGHNIAETNWPVGQAFQDDFLSFWSLGAAQDMKKASEMIGKPVDETMVEPFSLRMAQNAAAMKPADIEGVQKRLVEATNAYNTWIKDFDVVLSPVFSGPPSPLGYLRGDVPFDTLRERLLQQCGYTLIHNVAGTPAISLPLGWTSAGLPVGVQISAAAGQEKVLLELAFELEAAQPWIAKKPSVWAI